MAPAKPGCGSNEASEARRTQAVVRILLRKFMQDRNGATAVEYGLIAGIISIALVAGLTSFGDSFRETLLTLSNALRNGN